MTQIVLLLTLVLAPLNAFAQSDFDNYRTAFYAEVMSDNAKNDVERETAIGTSFEILSVLVSQHAFYLPHFERVTRKYMRRSNNPGRYSDIAPVLVRMGPKYGHRPNFLDLARDVLRGAEKTLKQKDLAPGKTINASRADGAHCTLPYVAENLYNLSKLVYPITSDKVYAWRTYAAEAKKVSEQACSGK